MPLIPGVEVGLFPALQFAVLPLVTYYLAYQFLDWRDTNNSIRRDHRKKNLSNGAVIGQSVETRSVSADLHSFGFPRMDFVLGEGTVFELNGRKLFLGLRYNHPLSRSEMYKTNMSFDDIAYKNKRALFTMGKNGC